MANRLEAKREGYVIPADSSPGRDVPRADKATALKVAASKWRRNQHRRRRPTLGAEPMIDLAPIAATTFMVGRVHDDRKCDAELVPD